MSRDQRIVVEARQGRVERQIFRSINAMLEPAIRAGVGSPLLWPQGLIVIESTGRRSGTLRRTPVAATIVSGFVVTGTFLGGRSDWIRNLRAEPEVRYWLRGAAHDATALLDPIIADADRVPLPVQWAALAATAFYGPLGQVVVLAPR
jgi:deazaflavin-dependent oxidoreductase (nitroreductase family)